jgi:hypothetical protein
MAAKLKISLESLDFTQKFHSLWTSFPNFCEFVWASRNSPFKPWSYNALRCTSYRGQEVSRGLTFGAVEAKVLEVFFRTVGSSEKNLSTVVKERDFVEDLYGENPVNSYSSFPREGHARHMLSVKLGIYQQWKLSRLYLRKFSGS